MPTRTTTFTTTEPTVEPVGNAWGNIAVPSSDSAADATATWRHHGWPSSRPAAAATNPTVGTRNSEAGGEPRRAVAHDPVSSQDWLVAPSILAMPQAGSQPITCPSPCAPRMPAATSRTMPASIALLLRLSSHACVRCTLAYVVRYRYAVSMSTGPMDPTEPRPAMRPVLSRDRIVTAAVEIVDEEGPDALTMRAVAQRLGAGTMSLYRHVSGREELLDLALGAMAAEVPTSPLTGDWRRDLAAIAADVRAGLLRRPHLTVLLTSGSGRGVADLVMLDRTLGVLRAAGFDRRTSVLATTRSATTSRASRCGRPSASAAPRARRAPNADEAAEAVARLPPDAFPNVSWVGPSSSPGARTTGSRSASAAPRRVAAIRPVASCARVGRDGGGLAAGPRNWTIAASGAAAPGTPGEA